MIRLSNETRGRALAKRVCREIERCGLKGLLTANFISELNKIRVGIPRPNGSLDCAIDYAADTEQIRPMIDCIHAHAASHAASRMPIRRAA